MASGGVDSATASHNNEADRYSIEPPASPSRANDAIAGQPIGRPSERDDNVEIAAPRRIATATLANTEARVRPSPRHTRNRLVPRRHRRTHGYDHRRVRLATARWRRPPGQGASLLSGSPGIIHLGRPVLVACERPDLALESEAVKYACERRSRRAALRSSVPSESTSRRTDRASSRTAGASRRPGVSPRSERRATVKHAARVRASSVTLHEPTRHRAGGQFTATTERTTRRP